MTGLTRQARTLAAQRICFVCHAPILEGAGIHDLVLGILTHQGECGAIVDAARRSYDRSPRGRWRPRGDVLRAIAGTGTLLRELAALERRA